MPKTEGDGQSVGWIVLSPDRPQPVVDRTLKIPGDISQLPYCRQYTNHVKRDVGRRSDMVVHLPIIFSSAIQWTTMPDVLAEGLRFAVLVMLSSLAVRIPREKLRDDAAG